MQVIGEENYREIMRTQVEPELDAAKETGFFERIPGETIYYEHYRAENARAVVVISHGFTESIVKFREPIRCFLKSGYDVWGVDHRGHGQSFRLNDNPYVVHVEHFRDYVLDLKYLTDKFVRPAAGKLPLYLYGHSMGGCIGAHFIESYPGIFDKAVLSSPMLGLSFGRTPVPAVYAAAGALSHTSKREETLTPISSFTAEEFENSVSNSRLRFDYYLEKRLADPRLQTSKPSVNWGKEAIAACRKACSKKQTGKIRIPVLICQAGNDTVVKNASQNHFASRVPGCELARFEGQKHELYMSDSPVQQSYWDRILRFLEQ
ncbi:MAG: alpha/beta hydrolase [Oscillospiraceae bacterium]|nr:alpha/beta hydrolase [Oscillospiraceae bacterium]